MKKKLKKDVASRSLKGRVPKEKRGEIGKKNGKGKLSKKDLGKASKFPPRFGRGGVPGEKERRGKALEKKLKGKLTHTARTGKKDLKKGSQKKKNNFQGH